MELEDVSMGNHGSARPPNRTRFSRSPSQGLTLGFAVLLAVAACTGSSSSSATPLPTTASPAAATPAATESAPSATTEAPASAEATLVPMDPSPMPDADAVVGNGKRQFAWASGLNENTIITGMQREIKDYASKLGWEVLLDRGTNSDIQPMVSSVQTWITAGVPAITVIPFQASAFEPLANQAIDKGLVWISYGQTMTPADAQIAFPPCDAAQLVAQATVDWINANAPNAEVLITSSPKIPEVACKWEGAQAAIESQTQATVVGVQEGTNQVQGLQVTQATLQAHPNLRVVVATNDDAAVGASQAFKAAGINPDEVFIIGYDGLKEALEQIRDGGYIKADAALNLKRLADKVAATNIYLAQTGRPPQEIEVVEPPTLVQQGSPEIDEILSFYGS
jgi:ribose transport system substrate-binding protein